MKAIIGLGNPGKNYQNTRHNVGFMVLDYIKKNDAVFKNVTERNDEKFQSVIIQSSNGSQNPENDTKNEHGYKLPKKIMLVYPQTFMNNSGAAVKKILDFYKIAPADIIILHDDIDLPLGTLKLSANAGDAGHNGVKSIIESLGSKNFTRIRIGIESRDDRSQIPTESFVLQPFSELEKQLIPFEEAAKLALAQV